MAKKQRNLRINALTLFGFSEISMFKVFRKSLSLHHQILNVKSFRHPHYTDILSSVPLHKASHLPPGRSALQLIFATVAIILVVATVGMLGSFLALEIHFHNQSLWARPSWSEIWGREKRILLTGPCVGPVVGLAIALCQIKRYGQRERSDGIGIACFIATY